MAKNCQNFFKQEFTRVKTKAEFLSQTLQESPHKHKLWTQLENFKEQIRELQRKLDTSSEELRSCKLDSVTNEHEQKHLHTS